MKSENFPVPRKQSVATDKFLFYFFGLRKGEVRRRVTQLRLDYPDESPEQLARRLISADTRLSLVSGAILNLAMFVPGVGQALRVLGFAGATAAISAMHVSLILEIAMLFGRDIDDRARLSEVAAVIAATGLASATPLLMRPLKLGALIGASTGILTAAAVSRLIGETSIRYYSRAPKDEALESAAAPVPAAKSPSSGQTVTGKMTQTPPTYEDKDKLESDQTDVRLRSDADVPESRSDADAVEPPSDEAAIEPLSDDVGAEARSDAGTAEPQSGDAAAEPPSDKRAAESRSDDDASGIKPDKGAAS